MSGQVALAGLALGEEDTHGSVRADPRTEGLAGHEVPLPEPSSTRTTLLTVFQPVEVCLWKSAILPPKDCAAVIRIRNLCEATFASVTAGRTWTVSAGLSVLFAFAWYTVFDAGFTVALHVPWAVDVTVRGDCCAWPVTHAWPETCTFIDFAGETAPESFTLDP